MLRLLDPERTTASRATVIKAKVTVVLLSALSQFFLSQTYSKVSVKEIPESAGRSSTMKLAFITTCFSDSSFMDLIPRGQ